MLLYTPYCMAMVAGGADAIRAERVAWGAGRRVKVMLVGTRVEPGRTALPVTRDAVALPAGVASAAALSCTTFVTHSCASCSALGSLKIHQLLMTIPVTQWESKGRNFKNGPCAPHSRPRRCHEASLQSRWYLLRPNPGARYRGNL